MRFAACLMASSSVGEEGEAVFLVVWYFSSPSLSSSLQACFYMWPHGIMIMVLGEDKHFFCLHLSFSPPTHPRWSGRWTEWEQCELNAEKTCDSAVQQGAAERKGSYSPCTLCHQVAVPSEMRRGPLRMEMCSPPAWQSGCGFFSAELISSTEESFFFKFVRNDASERGEASGWKYVGLDYLRDSLTDFLHDFSSSFPSLLMRLSLSVIGVWHKQQPDSTSWAWEVQVYSTFPGKWVTPFSSALSKNSTENACLSQKDCGFPHATCPSWTSKHKGELMIMRWLSATQG